MLAKVVWTFARTQSTLGLQSAAMLKATQTQESLYDIFFFRDYMVSISARKLTHAQTKYPRHGKIKTQELIALLVMAPTP